MDNDFKQKISNELFNITYDLDLIRKALLHISDDIQLNMTYCDVITMVLEKNELITRDEVNNMVLKLNDKRNNRAKNVMSEVGKRLKVVAEEQKTLLDLLENAPFKGEA
tara:strand:- start:255 stop:581 length:327 start_codon:yes stop_codon:yes gene_type:complete